MMELYDYTHEHPHCKCDICGKPLQEDSYTYTTSKNTPFLGIQVNVCKKHAINDDGDYELDEGALILDSIMRNLNTELRRLEALRYCKGEVNEE